MPKYLILKKSKSLIMMTFLLTFLLNRDTLNPEKVFTSPSRAKDDHQAPKIPENQNEAHINKIAARRLQHYLELF